MLGLNPVTVNSELELDKTDFGVGLRRHRLEVPAEFRRLLRRHAIRDISEFVSMIIASPTEISVLLDWTVKDVRRAERQLLKLLRRADPDPSEWRGLHRQRPGTGDRFNWRM